MWLLLHQTQAQLALSQSHHLSTCFLLATEGERQSIEKSNTIDMGEETGNWLWLLFFGTGRQLKLMIVDWLSASSKVFWLVFMAIICFVVLKTLILLSTKKFWVFFFGHFECLWIIFHSSPTTPISLFLFEVLLVFCLSLMTLVLQFLRQMFHDKNCYNFFWSV